ncbi:retrovirus-related pol polyprotein from transposon TNT 1-94 [Tanacetum coccineum]
MNSLEPSPSCTLTKVEVLKELPKVSMVNMSLKKLKHHLAGFDMVVKERTMTTSIIEGTWGFEHIKACFRDEFILFVKALKDIFNKFDQYLIDELTEVGNVFNQMEQAVINKDIVNIVVNSSVDNASVNVHECLNYLNRKKVDLTALKDDLRKLKGKALVDDAVTKHTINPEMFKVDVEPISPRLLNNRTAHSDYLKLTQEQAAILREVECYDLKGLLRQGLGHNLFSVGKFCDSNLEAAFRQHTCFNCSLEGVDPLTGSRGNNLYTLSIGDMMASSPICLLSKASKTKSWLWHRRLSHLNFGTLNHLARHGLVRGLPKLKFEMDHLCFACAMGKIKKKPHKPKSKDTN